MCLETSDTKPELGGSSTRPKTALSFNEAPTLAIVPWQGVLLQEVITIS